MALRKTNVTILVDRDFFEKLFEPSRESIQKKLGTRVSQPKFTRMLYKNKINLTPKLNFNFKMDIGLRKMNLKNGIKKTIRKKKRK